MSRTNKLVVPMVALGAVALLAWPVYAHCGKCALSAKEMVTSMDAGKVTLSSVITAAEAAAKGKAVSAHGHLDGKKLHFDVYCLVGEKIMKVEVDSTGKAGKAEEVKELPVASHEKEKPKPQPGG